MQTDPRALALALRDQHHRRERFQPVRHEGHLLTLQEAYQVQAHHVQQVQRERACALAGYKIGLTSAAMQEMCGIGHPVHGPVFADRVVHDAAAVSLASYGRLGVEFEIAVRLGEDLILAPGQDPLQAASRAVDAVAIALELVDDRHADYATLDASSLVADNAWNAGVVLGPWVPVFDTLGGLPARVLLGAEPVERGLVGIGAAHPLASLAWLASTFAQHGRGLTRGSFVMTGSIARTRFPAAGERWRFESARLGAVELSAAA
jgi:2-keto-4-pentenoate hydratase